MDINKNYFVMAKQAKTDSVILGSMDHEIRINALKNIATNLENSKSKIFDANKKDIAESKASNMPNPIIDRLKFDETKLSTCIEGIKSLIDLNDPLGNTMLKRQLDTDLILTQLTVPLGVIGVIFESRPDALVQISALCIKSGNCAILKGGREALHTNKALFDVIYEAGINAGMPRGFLSLVETRDAISELLTCHQYIDLIIPRGSNEFVQYIMSSSKIPVMGHADGICHIYVDKDADLELAVKIINDSKLQYPVACNAVETLLINDNINDDLIAKLSPEIELRNGEYDVEFLENILSYKKVCSLEEAINHINTYGSHHTDCIITENSSARDKFFSLVDSAGVFHNCSTRFADGFRYGLGAEVGISTGKLHARGPVGLEGLVTYKYTLCGKGQIVGDYADGNAQFDFKDLE